MAIFDKLKDQAAGILMAGVVTLLPLGTLIYQGTNLLADIRHSAELSDAKQDARLAAAVADLNRSNAATESRVLEMSKVQDIHTSRIRDLVTAGNSSVIASTKLELTVANLDRTVQGLSDAISRMQQAPTNSRRLNFDGVPLPTLNSDALRSVAER